MSNLQPIQPDHLYPAAVLERHAGITRCTLRKLRRERKLVVLYIAGKAFVIGSDFISTVRKHGKTEKDA